MNAKTLGEKEVAELLAVKESDVDAALVIRFFSNSKGAGKKVVQARYGFDDRFILPKDTLPNQHMKEETTVGRYFFNMFFIVPAFGDKIDYINYRIDQKQESNLNKTIVNLILDESIKPESFGHFHERLHWFKMFNTMIMPGSNHEMVYPSVAIEREKKRLLTENAEIIKNRDYIQYVEKVEKPLMEFAKKEIEGLEDGDSARLYGLKKPSFGNNYKSTILSVGPLEDPNGDYAIISNSLTEGIDVRQLPAYANSMIRGAYQKGVGTQEGGEMTKQLFSAFQTVRYIPGTDCETKLTRKFKVTSRNVDSIIFSYMMIDAKPVLITRAGSKSLIGKEIAMRTPLYCRDEDYCNICMGDSFRKMGIEWVGLTAPRATNSIMNLDLKSMHDTSIRTKEVDPFNYIQ